MIFFIFILAFCLASHCSILPDITGRLIGGQHVYIEDFPYLVSLQYLGEHKCGGAIIGKNYIITAAHCTDGIRMKQLKIRIGSSYSNRGGVLKIVSEIHQHPSYNKETNEFDISIIALSSEIEFGDASRIIPLAKSMPEEGTLATVSGWGYTKEGGPISEQLKAVQLPIVSKESCQEAYDPSPVTGAMICAGYLRDGGKDACRADSGGPLVINFELVGIVSWGEGCGRINSPGVYTSVAHLHKYIVDITGIIH